jgi:CheY-like chemotaxis protein
MSANGQGTVLISCKDQGAGLSPANLKLLFGEGVQFNANELQAGGGSGFGLFITEGIVLLHKGANIWAESEGEGKGCTFFVELPLVVITDPANHLDDDHGHDSEEEEDNDGGDVVVALQEKQDSSDLRAPSGLGIGLGMGAMTRVMSAPLVVRPKVLIVDDSAMNRRMLLHMLEAEGFECVQAVDGLAAVAYVKRASMFLIPPPQLGSFRGISKGDSKSNSVHSSAPNSGHIMHGSVHSLARTGSRASGKFATVRGHLPPDVILMDSNMPKMNGPEAIIEIRKLGYVSLIMGVTGDEDHASFIRAGADGVMMKPVKGAELLRIIRTTLNKQQQQQQRLQQQRQQLQAQLLASEGEGC